MIQLRALYYPYSTCSEPTLAKSILVLDQILFLGDPTQSRLPVEALIAEGYDIKFIAPNDPTIEDDLRTVVDADLQDETFRKTYFDLLHTDSSFLAGKVPERDYGTYGTTAEYRQKVLEVKLEDVPTALSDIGSYIPTDGGLPPELHIGSCMAADAFVLNNFAYIGLTHNLHLMSDSAGTDKLLKLKFTDSQSFMVVDRNIDEVLAFTLLQRAIPDEALSGKNPIDIVRFRKHSSGFRDKFKEYIHQVSVDLSELSGEPKEKKLVELFYRQLIHEVSNYQRDVSLQWNQLFSENVQPAEYNADDLIKQIVASPPVSVASPLVASATQLGISAAPNLVELLSRKSESDSAHPYGLLLK